MFNMLICFFSVEFLICVSYNFISVACKLFINLLDFSNLYVGVNMLNLLDDVIFVCIIVVEKYMVFVVDIGV